MIRTDDNAPTHSKFQLAGLLAYGWWHAALSYCGRQLTDGFISVRALPTVFPVATSDERLASIEALVREGCLHVVNRGERPGCHNPSRRCPHNIASEDGYVMHNYFRFQKPKRKALAAREFKIKAGRKGGENSWKSRQHSASAPTEPSAEPRSVPFRSDPIRSVPTQKQASRVVLSDDQFLNELKPLYPGIDVEQEANKLRGWLLTPKGRGKKFTRQRFVNWLNGCDKPLLVTGNGQSPRAINDPWAGKTEPREVKLK